MRRGQKKKKHEKVEKDPRFVTWSSGIDANVIHLSGEHSQVQIWRVMSSRFDTEFDEHVKHFFFSKYFWELI